MARKGYTPRAAAEARVSAIPTRQKAKQQRTTRIYLDNEWLPAIGHKAVESITSGDLDRVIAPTQTHVADATCNRILCAVNPRKATTSWASQGHDLAWPAAHLRRPAPCWRTGAAGGVGANHPDMARVLDT